MTTPEGPAPCGLCGKPTPHEYVVCAYRLRARLVEVKRERNDARRAESAHADCENAAWMEADKARSRALAAEARLSEVEGERDSALMDADNVAQAAKDGMLALESRAVAAGVALREMEIGLLAHSDPDVPVKIIESWVHHMRAALSGSPPISGAGGAGCACGDPGSGDLKSTHSLGYCKILDLDGRSFDEVIIPSAAPISDPDSSQKGEP